MTGRVLLVGLAAGTVLGVSSSAVVRVATAADVAAIVAFGEAVVPAHYDPLIGPEAAAALLMTWWGTETITADVDAGSFVVATDDGEAGIVGLAQRGLMGSEHVVWKLYAHPDHRGRGLGPQLLEALLTQLPEAAERVSIAHVAANTRAAAFYDREGFTVQHVVADPGGDHRSDTVWRSRPLRREG